MILQVGANAYKVIQDNKDALNEVSTTDWIINVGIVVIVFGLVVLGMYLYNKIKLK